jgi:hypothetical protein
MPENDIVENNEVIDFYTDEEAVEEMKDDEDSGEERRLKYFNPLDTINGDFDCLS